MTAKVRASVGPTVCIALAMGLACTAAAAAAETKRQKAEGVPFRTVFALSGLGDQWWVADYDHPARWFNTAWRRDAFDTGEAGAKLHLSAIQPGTRVSHEEMRADDGTLKKAGMTSKDFIGVQLQRRKWYGFGRYEFVGRIAPDAGTITAFYLYTGPHFGDPHGEIDFEFLGKDTTQVQVNRYLDGKPLARPPLVDLGFDAAAGPQLYAIEWTENAIIWFVGQTELFRLTDKENLPQPPMKLYLDLWAGGEGQAEWSGVAPADTDTQATIQCVSYSRLDETTPQCSDLMQTQ